MPSGHTYTAQLEARHIPDAYTDQEKSEGASWPLGAGRIQVGANVNGVWIPLAEIKASDLVEQFDQAGEQQARQADSQQGEASQPQEGSGSSQQSG